MRKNYGAAVSKNGRIVFGLLNTTQTEIRLEKRDLTVPVFIETFVSAAGYKVTPSSGSRLIANMKLGLRKCVERLAREHAVEFIFERPEEKTLFWKPYYGPRISTRKRNTQRAKNKAKRKKERNKLIEEQAQLKNKQKRLNARAKATSKKNKYINT